MSWTLDTPIRVGDFNFAAIVETQVAVRCTKGVVAAHGEKRATLLLLLRDDEVTGIDLSGRPFEAEEIALLYPKAIEQMYAWLGDG